MYTPPTIAEIKAQVIADIEGEIGQKTPILARAFVRVLAKALAGIVALLYRRILWSYLQIFPETASEEAIAYYEDRYGITPSPAVAAVLVLTVSGDEGATASSGTLWISEDNGLVYQQTTDVTLGGAGTGTVEVECLSTGSDTTLAADAVLDLSSPIDGIDSSVVTSITTEGEDADTLEERRAAVIERMRRTDEIGTAGWYITCALEVSGVALARVKRTSDGDVNVYPLVDITGSSRVPGSTMLATIQTYLQDLTRRPLCANVYAIAATERTATVTISGATLKDGSSVNATTLSSVESAIKAYFYAAYPRQYTDDAEATDWVQVGDLWAILIANSVIATGVTLTISGIGSGITSYQLPIGEIVAPGTITWA